jgi:predicted dehydrogenase
MKIGIVGTGNWGANLVRSFCSLIGSENVIVYDIDKDKLTKLRIKYPGIKSK